MVGVYISLHLIIDFPEIIDEYTSTTLDLNNQEVETQDKGSKPINKKANYWIIGLTLLGVITYLYLFQEPTPDLSIITERLKEIDAYNRNAILVASGVDDPRLR